MNSLAYHPTEAGTLLACTVSRDVRNFDLLIDDMEQALGEAWGDLTFEEARIFLTQPDAVGLQFLCVAIDHSDETDLAAVAEILALARTRKIKVILIADALSPVALHQLLRLGADDFVPYPLPDGALQEAIDRLRARPAPALPGPDHPPLAPLGDAAAPRAPVPRGRGDRNGLIFAVHGLSGGSGATTLAINLAWELANASKTDAPRVCLLDLDFQSGNIATNLDLPRRDAVFEMLSSAATLTEDGFHQALVSYRDRLQVLTAPTDMLPLDIVSPEDIGRLLGLAQGSFDIVIIDMPKTIVAWTETVLTRAELYLTTVELDLRSAQNVLRLVRALKAEVLPYEKLRYVLNRAPKFTDLTAKTRVRKMVESLDIKLELQVPDGGTQIASANDHGLPLAEAAPKNPVRREIQKLAKTLHDQWQASLVARMP